MNLCSVLEEVIGLTLTDDMKKALNPYIRDVTFEKGTIPVHEGDCMTDFYFIVSGLVRGYYLDADGNEVTKCFSCENQFFSSECFRTKLPSTFFIECLEDCQCIQVPYQIIEEETILTEKINYLYTQEVGSIERRVRSMLLLNAEERYKNFCNEYAPLCNRIPLKYIASYIGIEAASLSRIRHNLKN